MSDPSLDDLARRLEELPREAWDRPVPPPAPWPAEEQPARPERGRRLVLRPVAAALASAVILGLGVAAGLALSGDDDGGAPSGGTRVVLSPPEGAGQGPSGSADLASGTGGDATVKLTGLDPSSDDDFYELWLLGADGELVSLGSFTVPESGEAEIDVPVPVDPSEFDFLDVSLEPADGDPSHSKVSVLRGPTA